jgi:hypothetical protein
VPEEHASPTDLDEERVARIKDAQLRGAKTRRLKTEQRALNAFLQLGRCEDPDQKITVALICRQAGHMSQATFYGRFSGGTGDLLKIAAEQMRDDVNARVHKDLKAHPGIVSQNLRVTIAISRLVELLLEFPNLFNVDRIIPKLAIYALAETLFDAIVGDAPKSEAERERATVIAKYHTTSLIGILRTSLGDHIERSVFAIRLAERMISQVLPVLTGDDLAYRDEEQVVALLLAKSPTVAASARELKQTPLRS